MRKRVLSGLAAVAVLAMVGPLSAFAGPPEVSAESALPEVVEAVYVETLDAMVVEGSVLQYGKAPAPDYKDITDRQAAEDAAYLTMRGLFVGTGGGRFSPELPMTRGMAVTALHRLAGEPAVEAAGRFSDVEESVWYAAGAAWAVEAQVADQAEPGRFQPDVALTREQMLVMLYRYADSVALLLPGGPRDAAAWAQEAADWAINARIVAVDGAGELTTPLTRAQAAGLFRAFVEYLNR